MKGKFNWINIEFVFAALILHGKGLLRQSKLMHSILFIVLLNALSFSNSIAQTSNDTLFFLGNKNIAPVIFLEDSKPVGVVVDIVRAIAKHMPQPVKIIAMDWQSAQNLVDQGDADALMQINQTEERIKIYEFSDPLLESQFSIFVRSDRVGISGISSLRGLHVGVEAGGLPRELLDKNPNIPLTSIPNFLEGFKLLNKGTIDAVVVDDRVGSYILAENNFQNIKASGEPIAFSYSMIAVKKGNTVLLNAINNALRIIKADGTYRKILDKWKPKETLFYTREQITQLINYAVFFTLVVLLLIVVIWIMTLRKQLAKRKVAEEKLKGQYSTLHGIIDSANALIFSIDKQYRYTSFNNGHAAVMRTIYGAEIENGCNILDYMTVSGDREKAKRNLDKALAGEHLVEESYSGEELLSRKYFQVSHNPIMSEKEEIIGVVVFAQDLSERKRAEEELRKSETRYYNLFEDSPISLWEEDFSDVKKIIDDLRDFGVTDFRTYFDERPEELSRCVNSVKLITVNRTTLTLFKADSKESLLTGLKNIFTKESLDVFKEELIALAEGSKEFQSEAVQQNLAGEKLYAVLKLTIAPGYENTWEKVFVSLSDITESKRAKESLQKSHEELRAFFSQALDGCFFMMLDEPVRWDDTVDKEQALDYMFAHQRITQVNDAMLAQYGAKREQMLNLTPNNLFEHDIAYGRDLWRRFFDAGNIRMESNEQKMDGTPMWIEGEYIALYDLEGRIYGHFGIQRDITERKHAEEELKNTVARLNEAQRTAHIGNWELNLTTDVLLWSDEIYRIFEIDPDKFRASYEAFIEAIHPDDREAVNAAYTNSLKTKTPYMIDHRLLFPDGRIKYVHEQCETFYDEFGNPYRSTGIVQDITERKLIEQALLKSESGLKEAQRLGRLGSWDWDAITDSIHWSEEYYRIYGLDPLKNPPGYEEHLKAYTPESAARLDAAVKKNMEIGEPYELDLELAQSTEQRRWVTARSETKRNADGQIVGLRGTAQDITDRKKMEEEIRELNRELEQRVFQRTAQLESANKELEAFAYSVSHDLRAPLRSIDGFSQALLEDYQEKMDERARNYLQRVRFAAQRMAQLIDDLLDLSRVTRSEINIKQVNLGKVAREIADNLKGSQPQREIEFVIDSEIKVQGDGHLLKIVLENLIGNAWKFTSKRPKAKIEFGQEAREGGKVYFIRDDGAGFDMHYSQKLFGAFQRLHTVNEFSGTGIGLATVQRIIHRHGGKIWAEGEVGKGATFYFTI